MADEISGFLYSQIGYDLKDPMHAVVRGPGRDYLPGDAAFEVIEEPGATVVRSGAVRYWGELWKSHWWVVDFSGIESSGSYRITVKSGPRTLLASGPIRIASDHLWNETYAAVAIEQFEERARLARNGIGWKDCGSDWREVNSHASALIGLCDLLSAAYKWLPASDTDRLLRQLIHGCDYLAICQDKAAQVGFPAGALVHEIPNHMVVIPGDAAQSAVAFVRVSRLLADTDPGRSAEYLRRGVAAYEFLLHDARPYGQEGFSHAGHGAPEGFNVPAEWMTRDLLMMMWAGVELWASGKVVYKQAAVDFARRVMRRQVPEDRAEDGLHGHFFTFDRCGFTEKAAIHHHVGHDTGGTFPHYLVPLIDMTTRWYDHPDAPLWRETIRKFAYGYLLPACSRNPFFLLPMGCFGSEGLLVFCGPWHGANSTICFAASLASRLEDFTGDRKFREIATGNVQWIAGLNAGITRGSFDNYTLWKEDVPEGEALPVSQVVGVGDRQVQCWTGIRGTIPNGFSVNPQFQLVVKPSRDADGPWFYTDEDWIPHAAGWLSALTHMRERRFYAQ